MPPVLTASFVILVKFGIDSRKHANHVLQEQLLILLATIAKKFIQPVLGEKYTTLNLFNVNALHLSLIGLAHSVFHAPKDYSGTLFRGTAFLVQEQTSIGTM